MSYIPSDYWPGRRTEMWGRRREVKGEGENQDKKFNEVMFCGYMAGM